MNFFNSNCPSLATEFSFESNKKEIVQFLANPEVETDLKADGSYIEKLLVRSKDNNVANKQIVGDADATKLRHIKHLQRLNEELSTKSSIPVRSVKLKKSEWNRLDDVRQYFVAPQCSAAVFDFDQFQIRIA